MAWDRVPNACSFHIGKKYRHKYYITMAEGQEVQGVMADILNPIQLPKKSQEDWVKTFCEEHFVAHNDAKFAISYEYPYIHEANDDELLNFTQCKRCSRYCPGEMFANLIYGNRQKTICCICSNDIDLLPEEVRIGIKAMAHRISLRKNLYINRLSSYTCELCNITMTNSAKTRHEKGKLHANNLLAKYEKEKNSVNYETVIADLEDKVHMLETELNRAQNEADYFCARYEPLLKKKWVLG